jgi:hypothetical protein
MRSLSAKCARIDPFRPDSACMAETLSLWCASDTRATAATPTLWPAMSARVSNVPLREPQADGVGQAERDRYLRDAVVEHGRVERSRKGDVVEGLTDLQPKICRLG